MAVDYAALAQKFGGTSTPPVAPVDYSALAKKYGGSEVNKPQQITTHQSDDNVVTKLGNTIAGNQTPETGALFSTSADTVQKQGAVLTAAKTVGNVVPDFVRTTVGLPVQTAGLVGKVGTETAGLVKDSGGYTGAIKNLLSAFADPKTYIDTLKAIVPSAAQKVIKGDYNGAAQDISNHPFQQIAPFLMVLEKGAGAIDKVTGGTPEVKTFANGQQETPTISARGLLQKGTGAVVSPLEKGAQIVKNNIETSASTAKQSEFSDAVKTAQDEWNNEANNQSGKASTIFNKADERNINIPQILTDRGITSYSQMGEDGRFNTKPAALKLNSEASSLYKTTLNPLIQMADQRGVTVPLDEFKSEALKYAKGFNATSGDITSASDKINSEFSREGDTALKGKFGSSGINMSAAEAEKFAHWNEINWNKSVGKPTPDNIFNSAMGHAYQSIVERTLENQMGMPEGTIKNMNGEIGKLRQTADFLTQIDGDKPAAQPSKTLTGKILNKTIKLGVAGVGEAIGGAVGGVGGYVLARPLATALTEYLVRLPEATRTKILSELQATEPSIVGQIKDAITAEVKAQMTRLRLPAPAPLGSDRNPVIPDYSPPKPITSYEKQAPKPSTQNNSEPVKPVTAPPEKGIPKSKFEKEFNLRSGSRKILLRPKK